MTVDEIINKWIGKEFSGDPAIKNMEIRITVGLRADIQRYGDGRVTEEREDCAKIAEKAHDRVVSSVARLLAYEIRDAIRARCDNGGTK